MPIGIRRRRAAAPRALRAQARRSGAEKEGQKGKSRANTALEQKVRGLSAPTENSKADEVRIQRCDLADHKSSAGADNAVQFPQGGRLIWDFPKDCYQEGGVEGAWNGAITYGDVRTYLGPLAATLGWDKRADEHLSLACEFQERNGLLLWAARARLGWAEALARRGERERAGEEAARSLALAREHGYGAIEARASALVKTGAAAPHWPSGIDR
jgi:hypothetical protein